MKRLHVHVAVHGLAASIRFYSKLFAAGIRHLGIQVEDGAELADVYGRLRDAGGPVLEEGATVCCYAKSEKSWIEDPQGIQWETFLTSGESTTYGGAPEPVESAKPCCEPSRAA